MQQPARAGPASDPAAAHQATLEQSFEDKLTQALQQVTGAGRPPLGPLHGKPQAPVSQAPRPQAFPPAPQTAVPRPAASTWAQQHPAAGGRPAPGVLLQHAMPRPAPAPAGIAGPPPGAAPTYAQPTAAAFAMQAARTAYSGLPPVSGRAGVPPAGGPGPPPQPIAPPAAAPQPSTAAGQMLAPAQGMVHLPRPTASPGPRAPTPPAPVPIINVSAPFPMAAGHPGVAPAPATATPMTLGAAAALRQHAPPQRPPARQEAPRPAPSEDDARILPKTSITRLAARAAGSGGGTVSPEAEAALMALAEDWLSGALAFGCGAARRRRSQMLEAADLLPYLERIWAEGVHNRRHLLVPGFAGENVRAHKRPAASDLRRARAAAVRRAATEDATNAQAAVQAAATDGGTST